MRCPLCEQRKARRACPALGRSICPSCCGTKRLVEIRCPADCVYLEAAERHPAAAVKRRQEHDIGALMTALGPLSPDELRLALLIQSVISRFTPDTALSRLTDADVAEAVGALAATRATAAHGVVYEHTCTAPVAEALRREVGAVIAEMTRGAGSRLEPPLVAALRAIERAARGGDGASDRDATAYLTLAGRVMQDRPLAARADDPDEPRIVITG